jgi:hypothetical protein
MYLPLYHPGTPQHINNPLILPHPISHGSPESIDGFTFVFVTAMSKATASIFRE